MYTYNWIILLYTWNWSHLCGSPPPQNKTETHKYKEQIGVARGRGWEVGEMGEGGKRYKPPVIK